MEMAANDQVERNLTALDLAVLERAWQEAERIAEIADGLLVPHRVESALRRLKADHRAGHDEIGSSPTEGER